MCEVCLTRQLNAVTQLSLSEDTGFVQSAANPRSPDGDKSENMRIEKANHSLSKLRRGFGGGWDGEGVHKLHSYYNLSDHVEEAS